MPGNHIHSAKAGFENAHTAIPGQSGSVLSVSGVGAWLTRSPGIEEFWETECGLKKFLPVCEAHEESRMARWLLQSFYDALSDSGLASASLETSKIHLIAGLSCPVASRGFVKLLTKHLTYLAEVEELTAMEPLPMAQELFRRAGRILEAPGADHVIISLAQDNSSRVSDTGAVTLVCTSNRSRFGDQANHRTIGSLEMLPPGERGTEAAYFGICSNSESAARAFLITHARAASLDHRLMKPWLVDITVIGHSEGRSTHAFAPVLKALLALDRGVFPKTQSPHPAISGFRTGLSRQVWFGNRDPHRRAIVALLDQSGPLAMRMSRSTCSASPSFRSTSPHLYCFSGASPDGLLAELKALRCPTESFIDASELSRRVPKPTRLAVLANDQDELRNMLDQTVRRISASPDPFWIWNHKIFYSGRPIAQEAPKVAMMFPGQGSQFFRMNEDVLLQFPVYRRWVEAWNCRQGGMAPRPIAESIYPEEVALSSQWRQICKQNLDLIEVGGQAALISSLAMSELLQAYGVKPDALVGCSNGENIALAVGGTLPAVNEDQVLDLMSSLKASFLSRAGGPLANGKMLSVTTRDRAALFDLIAKHPGQVYLALDNCPTQVVLFVRQESLRAVSEAIHKLDGMVLPLPFERPYHTPLFAAASKKLSRVYAEMDFGPFKVPTYSCATASTFPDAPDQIKEIACSLWHKPVLFRETIERMYADGIRIFLEVGPGSRLVGFVRDTLHRRSHFSISASSDTPTSMPRLLGALALLFVSRVWDPQLLYPRNAEFVPQIQSQKEPAPQPTSNSAGRGCLNRAMTLTRQLQNSRALSLHFSLMSDFLATQENLALAFYRTLRKKHSISAVVPGPAQFEHPLPPQAPVDSRLLSQRHNEGATTSWFCDLDIQKHAFLRDHAFGKIDSAMGRPRLLPLPIVPLAYSLELALQAAEEASGHSPPSVEFSNVAAFKWITLEHARRRLRVQLDPHRDGSAKKFSCSIKSDDPGATPPLFKADLALDKLPPAPICIPRIPSNSVVWSASDFYDVCLFHGESFRVIHRIRHCSHSHLQAEVTRKIPSEHAQQTLLPVDLIDALGQLGGYWLVAACGLRDFGAFPVAIGSLIYLAKPDFTDRVGECRATFKKQGDDVTADLDVIDGCGRLCIAARRFRMRIFQFSTRFMATLYWQRPELDFSTPTDEHQCHGRVTRRIDLRDHPYLEDGNELWMNCLAFTTLTAGERTHWSSLTGPRVAKLDWLMGRIAIKDAVREVLRRTRRIARLASEIEVPRDSENRFQVAIPITGEEKVQVYVSLYQENRTTVASADLPSAGVISAPPGIVDKMSDLATASMGDHHELVSNR
jgi:malonyl CoA-acyl carrier protein transacylase